MVTLAVSPPEGFLYSRGSAQGADLPAPLSAYALQRAVPSARGGVTAPSPRRPAGKSRNLNRVPIGLAPRLILRIRLTPGRLALPGKPWSFGESASNALYRYLYLHLLFQRLQRPLPERIQRRWNAPLPMPTWHPAASVAGFIPDYYPRAVPRLVSCYALFE